MSQNKSPLGIANHYLAKPKSGKGKAVLVLHAWWGLNPFIKKFGVNELLRATNKRMTLARGFVYSFLIR